MPSISTESYKGVRDFYPEDWQRLQHIFKTIERTVESFGYQAYNASPLEPTELYASKTSDEIVSEQTYTFIDRGGRSVTLRPEMTPTVSRMIAAQMKSISFPVRWYSVPNIFRYEKPQRGRLREHYQLNVDLFGVEGIEADVEMIHVAHTLLTSFNATEKDFIIRINSRKLLNHFLEQTLSLSPEQKASYMRLLDKKNKIDTESFSNLISDILKNDAHVAASHDFFTGTMHTDSLKECNETLIHFRDTVKGLGITNVEIDYCLVRGFDYYTDFVFEVFDTHPENNRSLFGGGRYDGLVSIFGEKSIPAVGFGMGDVTLQDFLGVRGLLPQKAPFIDVYICRAQGTTYEATASIAQILRLHGLRAATDLTQKKIGDQIHKADKDGATYVLIVGENELQSGHYIAKKLSDGSTIAGTVEYIAQALMKA